LALCVEDSGPTNFRILKPSGRKKMKKKKSAEELSGEGAVLPVSKGHGKKEKKNQGRKLTRFGLRVPDERNALQGASARMP